MHNNLLNAEELFICSKLIAGDVEAFKYFFDTYYSDMCNFINHYVRDQQISEELIQDVFVNFWENKKSLNITSSVKSYLYTAAKYKGLNHIRNSKRHDNIISKIKFESTTEIPYDEFDQSLLNEILAKAINSLPPKCLQIFKLSRDPKLSNKDIASKLGISVKTVENQMTIAYKKLRILLQPYKDQLLIIFIMIQFL